MLYVTTRNNRDAFTAQRALMENRCRDGGMYLPFRAPQFTQQDLDDLTDKPFNQCVADVLNRLFRTKLTGWNIDFAVGRYPVRLVPLRHRIVMAETWHNPEWNYDAMVRKITRLLCEEDCEPSDWVKIAVRVAVLFGIFLELKRSGVEKADISLLSSDFSAPISAWYARQWGLPVGNIICCCNENKNLWDLICHGQLRTDLVSIPTSAPDGDVALPIHLERLIYECGGIEEVLRYLDACRLGKPYFPKDAVLSRMHKGLFVSVVSSNRMETTIPSVYRTHGYMLSPCAALVYAGLQDYRAKTGETRTAVVLSEQSPAHNSKLDPNTHDLTVDGWILK